jgi:methionyl-tRNA formyltransferase
LDFTAPASALAARINGLFPWPGCSVEIGGTSVKLGLADAVVRVADPGYNIATPGTVVAEVGDLGYNIAIPGTVVGIDAEGLLVKAGEGILRLRKLQRPGGRLLTAPEFLRGFPIAEGARLPSQTISSLVSTQPFRCPK